MGDFTKYFMLIICILHTSESAKRKAKKKVARDGESSISNEFLRSLTNDANLDLSVDEEYEDLRAELLAYHAALAHISTDDSRRSLLSTPCWSLGGICVKQKLCTGFRFLTQVPGCKGGLNVCCFTWNKFQVRDMREQGFKTFGLPWSNVEEKFGGEGVIDLREEPNRRNKSTTLPGLF